jgi:uncharacterized protein RhaS with RHS repeats
LILNKNISLNAKRLGSFPFYRFRYYDSNTGTYISQDPIGLAGNNPNFYAYVHDSNAWVDLFVLSNHPSSYITFTDSKELSLTVNGYTNISHLSKRELEALYYANSGSGWGLSPKDKKKKYNSFTPLQTRSRRYYRCNATKPS